MRKCAHQKLKIRWSIPVVFLCADEPHSYITPTSSLTYYYDAKKGLVSNKRDNNGAYGKPSDAKASDNIECVTGDQDLTKDIVKIEIGTDGAVKVTCLPAK